ncbi:MAG: PAS domain S-box protein, partial [Deinococcales bacterium]|nr:PAS domain S-box protein [Chitinophagaceae bacterium]
MKNSDYQDQLFKLMPLPGVLLAVDAPRYTVVNVNDAFLKTTNTNKNNVIGKGIFEAIPNNPKADGVQILVQSLETAVHTKQPQKTFRLQYDIPITGTDDFEKCHFDCETISILNNNGNIEFILYTLVDVTEKVVNQQTTNTLLHRNEFIENVLHSLPFGITVNKISDGSAAIINKQFSKIYGWDETDFKDVTTFFEKIYPDPAYRNEIASRIINDLQSGDAEKMCWNGIAIMTKTGEKRIVNAKNVQLLDQDLMIFIVTDVTTYATQQLEINRIKSNQEALINATHDAIWSIDTNLCIITANNAYLEIVQAATHVQPKEGDSVFVKAFGDELNKKWKEYYNKALNGENYALKEQFYNPITKTNEYNIISFNPIHNADNVITGIACYSKNITDEVITQQVLEATKNKLSKVLDSSLDVICVVNEHNIFLQVSAASEAVWGYRPEELVGKSVMDFVYADDLEQTKAKAATIMAGNKATYFENRYVRKDGSLVWMEWTASWDEHSKVRYGVARDVTEKKQQQIALSESEKKYKNLFDNNPSPMFIWDFETLKILDCNEEALLKYGYTKAEFLQLTIKDIRPAEDILIIEAAIKSEDVYGNIHKQIWRHQKKNGDIMFMDITGHLINYHGRRASLLVLLDVTEKIEIEDQIKTSEAKYRLLVESSLDGILLTIKNGNVISANAAACEIFSMTEKEICNAGKEDLIDMTDPRLPLLLQQRELTGKATGELTFKRKDGSTFSGEITSVIFKDVNGVEKSSMTIRDITEIKKITAQKDNLLSVLQKSLNEIYIFNPQTLLFEYVNDSSLKNLGFSLAEMITMTPVDIKPEFTTASFKQLIEPLLTCQKEKIVFESQQKRANNSLYPVEVHLQLVKDFNQTVILGVVLDITEREKAKDELKQSEEKYKILFVRSPLPKFIYDIATFNILEVNDAVIEHYGYSRNEFLKLTLSDLRPESDIPNILNTQTSIKNIDGIVRFGIFTHLKKDGTTIQVEISGNTFTYQHKNCMMVECVDVTERELALVKLNESNQRYNYVTKATFDAIWDWDITNDTLYWGEGYQTLFGYNITALALNISSWSSKIHPDDIERVVSDITLIVNSNKTNWEDGYRYQKQDNSYANVIDRGFVIRDEQGKALRMVGSMRDITKSKQEEQHLKLLESVIVNTTDAVLITDAQPFDEPGPKIIYSNEAFTKMTGYTQADVIGKSPRILQGPNTNKADLKQLGQKLRKWENCELTTLNYKKNGEEIWIHMSITPVADKRGCYTHWIAIERDVTHLKKAELQKALVTDITQLFNQPVSLSQVLQNVLAVLANFIKVDVAEIWLISTDKKKINLFAKHTQTQAAQSFHQDSATNNSFIKGQGLPGIIWEKETIQLWHDLQDEENFIRKEASKKAGLKCAYGLPLFYNKVISGVIILASNAKAQNANELHQLFETVGNTISAEIKRKQLEQELNQIFSFAPDIICIAGTDGYFKKVNPAACELLEYNEEELLTQPYSNFLHPNDKEATATEANNLKHGINRQYFENRYITKSGKIIWLAWTCSPSTDEHLIYAVAKDISDKKELENRLHKINTLSKIGNWEANPVTNSVYWSDVIRNIHEVDRDFVPDLNTALHFFKEGENRTTAIKKIETIIKNGISWDVELQIITAKGNQKWIRVICDADFVNDQCVRLYGSFQDIDERKKGELAIIEACAEKNTVLESIDDGFFAIDKNAIVTYWNTKAEILLNAKKEAVIGKNLHGLFKNNDSIVFYDNYKKAIIENVTVQFEEFSKRTNKWFAVSAYPSQHGLSVYFKDVTHRKQAEIDIKTSEEKRRLIMNGALDAIICFD